MRKTTTKPQPGCTCKCNRCDGGRHCGNRPNCTETPK
jgi:hypothetical protein